MSNLFPYHQNLTKTLYTLIADKIDLEGLAKSKRINYFHKLGRILMRLRPSLTRQLGRIKRGILPNADTSEYHRFDENFTNLFCITPHLCSLELCNEEPQHRPSNSPLSPLSCRFCLYTLRSAHHLFFSA
jgi:hypothetical protein